MASNDAPPPDAAGKGLLGNLMRLVGRSGASDLARRADALLSGRGEASGVALATELSF